MRSGRGKRLARVRKDLLRSRKAQMPFSIAAVLLLVLSSTAIVLLHHLDNDTGRGVPAYLLEEMKDTASDAALEFEEAAYGAAMEAIRSSLTADENQLRERFHQCLEDQVLIRYPSMRSGMEVSVDSSSVNISFLMVAVEQLYPELSPDSSWNVSTVPAYFTMSGQVTVIVVDEGNELLWNHSLDRGIYLPYPLLNNRINSLWEALTGGKCEFENLVRYQLSSLAQDRVLRGYGMGSREGARGTSSILTEEDVTRAIKLALALEMRKHMRVVPPSLNESFPSIDLASLGGTIDPADLFLSTYGEDEYDLGQILAQSLYAAVDMLVIRWLDYLHIIDLARWSEGMLDEGQIFLWELIDDCLGTDILRDTMVKWIREGMEDAGFTEQVYRYMHYGAPDGIVEVPEMRMVFINDLGEQYPTVIGGKVEVDFPSQDIFRSPEWERFLVEYKRGTFELAEQLRDFLISIVTEISESIPLGTVEILHDPSDGISFVSEVTEKLTQSMLDASTWVDEAIERSGEGGDVIGSLEEAFIEFLRTNWQSIFSMMEGVYEGISQVSEKMVDQFTQGIPAFGEDSRKMAIIELNNLLINSSRWSILDDVIVEFRKAVDWRIGLFEQGLLVSSGLGTKGLRQVILDMAKGAVKNIPGIRMVVFELIDRALTDMADGFSLRNEEMPLHIPEGLSYTIKGIDGSDIEERILIEEPLEVTGLRIEIAEPWAHDSSSEFYPNRHITEPKRDMLSPYATQWNISFSGYLRICIRGASSSFPLLASPDSAWTGCVIPFGSEVAVTTIGGWPLKGIDYSPSSRLLDEVLDFFEKIWEGIVDALKFVAEAIGETFSFFKSALSNMLSYSTGVVKLLAESLQEMVVGLQELLMSAGGTAVALLASLVESLFGTVSLNLTILGMRFMIETNVADLALGITKDVLKVTFSMSVLGSVLSHSLRLVRLGSGNYDFIINCTLSSDDWRLSVVVDPLMKLFNHFVEIKGIFHGLTILLHLPEVVQYERYRLSLSQLPSVGNFLSNIPFPIPGTKGSIDVGFELKFNYPFASHPLINEYEQNPPGVDAGNEWLELYNPTGHAISLKGWSIETSHGTTRLDTLEDLVIMPYSYLVYTFNQQTLDNGGSGKFPVSECAVLKDDEGMRVDSTPWTTDFYNDGRTWQREFDGSDRWAFREATKGLPNGKMMAKSSEIKFLKNALWDSAAQAFAEMQGLNSTLESLAEFSKRTLENFWNRCVDLIANSIVEMRFFVEAMVGDLTSSLGGGLEVSLVITGDCVREAISWMASQLLDVLKNLINPCTSGIRSSSASQISQHLHLRLSVYTEAGLPRMLGPVTEGMSFRMKGIIQANLACIGVACGKDWGEWEIGFGAMIEGIPGGYLPPTFGVDADRKADVWLMKGIIFAS